MVKKLFACSMFGIGCLFCMVGGCALDSESLIIPMGLIGIGLIIGSVGYHGIRRIDYGQIAD